MADKRTFIQLSIFDRLDGTSHLAVLGGRVADIHIVKRAVVRDVENLLNTRRIIIDPPESCKHLKNSLFVYGIEDFVAKNPRNPEVYNALQKSIYTTLSKFEPRLKDVTIQFKESDGNEQNLCFTVTATLYADPIHEPIYFDTWFLVNRGEYQIKNTK